MIPNHIVRNNLTGGGSYPLFVTPGKWTDVAGPGSVFAGNVAAGPDAAYYGSIFAFTGENFYPTSLDAIGPVGGGSAAYNVGASPTMLGLTSSTPYKGKATDGTDPGANIATLMAAIANAIVP